MGPITLFDKSFLQSLSVDESVWFDHFFYPNICPLFYVETLADLNKTSLKLGRTVEDEVRIIADKTPELSGSPCVHHRELCISDLMGHHVPMNGQIPVAGGRVVRSADGKKGIVYDQSPEAQAFIRWQHGEFQEIERHFAKGWRQMLTTLDLPAIAANMRTLGLDAKNCKSVDEAHAIATKLVNLRNKPFEQMALLFAFVDIPSELQRPILERWSIYNYRPLAEYAPYAAHVLTVELFFQIGLAANIIPADRASNRVDIAYLFYLPFCMVFVSSDKLHRKCARVFLRKKQDFIWGFDLKPELTRLNNHFAQFSESEREKGVMKFARLPVGNPENLIIKLWNKHDSGWQKRDENDISLTPEVEKKLVEHLRKFTDSPTVAPQLNAKQDVNLDQLAIQRKIRKKKGSWWLLPKDLEDDKAG